MRKGIMKAIAMVVVLSLMIPLTSSAGTTGSTYDAAIKLKLGEAKSGTYTSENITGRWYKVTTTKDGILKVTLKSDNLKQNGSIIIYECKKDLTAGFPMKQTFLQYNEKKKTQSATLSSGIILEKGSYYIQFKTDSSTLTEKVKYTISAKTVVYDDKEPNDSNESAQTLKYTRVNKKKAPISCGLNATPDNSNQDVSDAFVVTLPQKATLDVAIASDSSAKIMVTVYKVGKQEEPMFSKKYTFSGKKKTINYKSGKKLAKGKYIVRIDLLDEGEAYFDYNISAFEYKLK